MVRTRALPMDQPMQHILKELVDLGIYNSETAALNDAIRKLAENYGIFSEKIFVDGILVDPCQT